MRRFKPVFRPTPAHELMHGAAALQRLNPREPPAAPLRAATPLSAFAALRASLEGLHACANGPVACLAGLSMTRGWPGTVNQAPPQSPPALHPCPASDPVPVPSHVLHPSVRTAHVLPSRAWKRSRRCPRLGHQRPGHRPPALSGSDAGRLSPPFGFVLFRCFAGLWALLPSKRGAGTTQVRKNNSRRPVCTADANARDFRTHAVPGVAGAAPMRRASCICASNARQPSACPLRPALLGHEIRGTG
jgi:hypothetical protein